jgi:hypothetical protein
MKLLLLLCVALTLTNTVVSPQVAIAGDKNTTRSQSQETILGVVDRQIVPGKRVGAIVKTSTHQDLVKLFGTKKLRDRDFYGPEGQVKLPATVVKFGKNKELEVIWKDSQRNRVFMTIVRDADWQTKSGIRVGMTFPQLRKIVGKFQVSGLDWDYGNSVIFPEPKTYPFKGMGIKVNAAEGVNTRFPQDYQAVSGDTTIADDDPRWKNLNMRVITLEVYYQ